MPMIVSRDSIGDNPQPERPGATLMPSIWGRARPENGAPQSATARPPHAAVVTAEADFLAALPVIDDVTGHVCRRHRLSATEADDLRSDVRFHFLEKNYEVLRKFEGRCALATYVNVVVQRVFLDWRNRMWGRWRPSTEARRLGPTAILIERLVVRDAWTMEQALEMVRVNHGVTVDDALRAFGDTLAGRGPARRRAPEEDADDIASPGPAPDANVVLAEREFLAKRVQAAIARAREGLAPLERLILKMRFDDHATVSEIARALHLEQRPLYRTIERQLAVIGATMEAEGISRADIATLLDTSSIESNDNGPSAEPAAPGAAIQPTKGRGASWLRSR